MAQTCDGTVFTGEGSVKFFTGSYGIVAPDDVTQPDVYVTAACVAKCGLKGLKKKARVYWEAKSGPKNLRAISISLVIVSGRRGRCNK